MGGANSSMTESSTRGEKNEKNRNSKYTFHTRPTLLRSKRLNGLEETASV